MSALSPIVLALLKPVLEPLLSKAPWNPIAVAEKWQAWNIAGGILTLGVAVVLLVGGIGLCKRRHGAASTMLTWAVLKIIVAAYASVLAALMQMDMFTGAQQMSTPGMPAGLMRVFALFGAVFGLAWGWPCRSSSWSGSRAPGSSRR